MEFSSSDQLSGARSPDSEMTKSSSPEEAQVRETVPVSGSKLISVISIGGSISRSIPTRRNKCRSSLMSGKPQSDPWDRHRDLLPSNPGGFRHRSCTWGRKPKHPARTEESKRRKTTNHPARASSVSFWQVIRTFSSGSSVLFCRVARMSTIFFKRLILSSGRNGIPLKRGPHFSTG